MPFIYKAPTFVYFSVLVVITKLNVDQRFCILFLYYPTATYIKIFLLPDYTLIGSGVLDHLQSALDSKNIVTDS